MKSCQQTDFQTIYEHGKSVSYHIRKIFDYLDDKDELENWKIPDWLVLYRKKLNEKLLNRKKILRYALFHDCGKPFCLQVDETGKRHFPCHAQVSYDTWLKISSDKEIARLIRMDMDVHLLRSDGIAEFARREEAITLLIAGLAEVHSNAQMFGGLSSTSFKIKWKRINAYGNKICDIIFSKGNIQ